MLVGAFVCSMYNSLTIFLIQATQVYVLTYMMQLECSLFVHYICNKVQMIVNSLHIVPYLHKLIDIGRTLLGYDKFSVWHLNENVLMNTQYDSYKGCTIIKLSLINN